MYNCHKIGTKAELIAQEYFIENDCIVSKPINHFSEYDLVIDYSNNLFRIQVKSLYKLKSKSNINERYICKFEVARRLKNGIECKKYNESSFDLLCGVELETKLIYIIPVNEVIKRKIGMSFYPKCTSPNKHRNEIYRFNNSYFKKSP